MDTIQWDEHLPLIEATLCQEKDDLKLASMSAIMVNDQRTIYAMSSGYARLEDRYRAETASIYRLGSISKVFIAHMLMHLRDAGRLALGQPLHSVLPQFDHLQTDVPVTFHHLVTHTSGLPLLPPIEGMMDTLSFPDVAQLLDSLAETSLLFQPGTGFCYSNFGVALLAHALAEVARLPCADYIKEHFLQPLAMNHSGYTIPETAKSQGATGYISADGQLQRAPAIDIGAFTPIGNLCSSAEDMAKFMHFQLAETNTQPMILSRITVEEMQTFISFDENLQKRTAIGWRPLLVNGIQVFAHGGADMAFVSYFAIVPSRKFGMFLATNTGVNPEKIAQVAYEILALIL